VRKLAYNNPIVRAQLSKKIVPRPEPNAQRWRCECAYDGTDFSGWQSQPNRNGIQDFLEKRLEQIFKKPVRVHGSGRTDAGVHARAQVFHFDAFWPHEAQQLLRAFYCGLPAGVQVRAVKCAPKSFHARYGATGKRYRYRIHLGRPDPFELRWCWAMNNRPLDIEAMRAAAKHLLGTHDFSAFCAKNSDDITPEDAIKDMRRLDIVRRGANQLDIVTEASGYLYKMVRTIAGALVEVGLGKLNARQINEILKSRTRTYLVPTAPAQGLCLERVFYGQRAKKLP